MCVAAPPVGGHGGVLLLGYGDRSRRPGGGQRPGRHGEIHLRRRRERRVHRRIEQNVVDRQKRTRLADRLADERRFETPGDGPPHGGSQRRPGAQRPSDHLRRSLGADGDRHAGGLSRRADHHPGRTCGQHHRFRIHRHRTGHLQTVRQRRLDGRQAEPRLGRGRPAFRRAQAGGHDYRDPDGQPRRRPRRLGLVPGGGHGAGRSDGPPGGLPRRADARRHGSR